VAAGSGLSEAQEAALVKMGRKYAAAVPSVKALLDELYGAENAVETAETVDAGEAAAMDAECRRLFEIAAGITEWRPAVKRGKRTYDDSAFVTSLREQYEHRKVLSPRQVACLRDVLARYGTAAAGEAEGAASPVTPAAKPARRAAETLDEKCPQCGAPLQKRFSRVGGRPFVGCSGYPKCKYTRKADASAGEK
jgi:hypothetical protein